MSTSRSSRQNGTERLLIRLAVGRCSFMAAMLMWVIFSRESNETISRPPAFIGPVSVRRPLVSHFSSKSHAEDLGYGTVEATARFFVPRFHRRGFARRRTGTNSRCPRTDGHSRLELVPGRPTEAQAPVMLLPVKPLPAPVLSVSSGCDWGCSGKDKRPTLFRCGKDAPHQSVFMSTTIQPRIGASAMAVTSLPLLFGMASYAYSRSASVWCTIRPKLGRGLPIVVYSSMA